jgi:arylformamidase
MTTTAQLAEYIDISLVLSERLPVWPTSERFQMYADGRISKGGNNNTSSVKFNLHTGTHVDAPWHFLDDGVTVDRLALADLIGVARIAHVPGARRITPGVLDGLNLPTDTRRLLLRTDNSLLWANHIEEFSTNFVALTPEAAEWVVARDIRLIGVDYLSVQCFHDPDDRTHQVLLKNRVVVVEGLNLCDVEPGEYNLICLPIRIHGAEAAPARVLLGKSTG